MSQHIFDQSIALGGEPDNQQGTINPAYQNMVGPFGGVTAATLLQSVLQHPSVKGTPVSMTVNFLGAIQETRITVQPRMVRENRTNQHWSVEAVCGAETVATATLVFASRVDAWKSTEISMPSAPRFDEIESLSTELLPPWVQQYDMRFVRGNPLAAPEQDTAPSETLHWISDRPARALDFTSLCALCDTFFPRLFIHTRQMVPFGTVTFTVYFHVTQQGLDELDSPWVLGHARASKFYGSYFDQSAEVWGANGNLLATTTQLAYYKY